MVALNAFLLAICISLSAALPTKPDETSATAATTSTVNNFASDASKLIAVNMLKSNIDIDGNQVHSPLGVSSILAVLAEAAAGATFAEFQQVFAYPQERGDIRAAYKRILGKYQNREYSTEPSFQTWLYIYRNYSAREDFKQLVRDHYYVEVKDINRYDYDWSEPNTSLDLESTTASNSKDVVGFETLKRIKIDDIENPTAAASEQSSTVSDSFGEEVINKDASKFDRFVEDKQYVEKPVILEEIKREQEEQKKEQQAQNINLQETQTTAVVETPAEDKTIVAVQLGQEEQTSLEQGNLENKDMTKRQNDAAGNVMPMEENETVQNVEKLRKTAENSIVPIQELIKSNEPQKISLPLQKLENAIEAAAKAGDGEIMWALESHIRAVRRVYGARSLFHKDDITTALSANSITGREVGSKSKMLLFNGLYYRGNWAIPFYQQPSNIDEHFFMTSEDAMKTPMMHAKGKYYVADLEHLNARALCVPYENKKYSMLIIVPKEIEGLHSVIEKFQPSDLHYVREHAQEKELHITMPKFQAEETSRSEAMLKTLGLQKLFSRHEADLSLLSDDKDLHIDEVVQFVSVRVDEGDSSANALSVTNAQIRSSDSELEMLEINHPFLYFIMDCEEEFVIASGKIYSPELVEDLPISIEIEYHQQS